MLHFFKATTFQTKYLSDNYPELKVALFYPLKIRPTFYCSTKTSPLIDLSPKSFF